MSILDQIVEATRDRVRKQRQEVPIRELEDLPLFGHSRRSLHGALSKQGISVIAEIKRASPSKGILSASIDPSQIASTYEMNGAAAVSVLTEPDYFQGSLEDLQAARKTASIPILRKDFVVDPYQLLEARAHGADAVLLIATVLDRSHLTDLLQAAEEIGVDHLVEVYRERELDRIDFSLVRTIGANNRDLDTFEVDVERAARTLRHVPTGVLRVAESGIASREDVLQAAEGGADAVLVGETLMKAEDPGMKLRSLLSDSAIELGTEESHRNPE